MPYKVISETSVSLLTEHGTRTDPISGVVHRDHTGFIALPGEVIPDDQLSTIEKDAYEAGDEHIHSLIEHVSDSSAAKKRRTTSTDKEDE